MKKEQRFNYILEKLQTEGVVDFTALSEYLLVSEDTIRRDVDYLATHGLLSKVRGGAIPRSLNPLTFKERINYLSADKEIIALKAQPMIKNGMTIFMDGGTSNHTLANLLPTNLKLTVITNNIAIVPVLSNYPHIQTIVLGGNYVKETEVLSGLETVRSAEKFRTDIYFMGVCAINLSAGITTTSLEEAELKQAMLKSSKLSIALSTFDKLGTIEPYHVCPLNSVGIIITETDTENETLLPYKKTGVKFL